MHGTDFVFISFFQGDSKHDAKIFALSILLSSTLVYNSRGTIDNKAIEALQYPFVTVDT